MEVDPRPTEVAERSRREPTPLDLDLSHSTRHLLRRIGYLDDVDAHVQTEPSVFRYDQDEANAVYLASIPLQDLAILVSAIPRADVPLPREDAVVPFDTPPSRTELVDTLARLALSPALTLAILSSFRPIALALVGRWFDLLGLDDEGRWRLGEPGVEQAEGERAAVEKVWSALAVALPLLRDELVP